MDIKKDFSLFAKDKGISSLDLYYNNKRLENSLTPYVIEERPMNMIQIDVFSLMMKERIIWLVGEVNDSMSTITQAQLQYLDSVDNNDITFQINTPGGSVQSGLGIISTMEYIRTDVKTINMSMCASMGSVLLAAGTKGKRFSLKYADVMIHQSSGGVGGNISDAEISYKEWIKKNNLLFDLLGEYTGKTSEQIKIDAARDLWLSPDDAIEYGIIDAIVQSRKK